MGAGSGRARQSRSIRNDERILDAALELLADEGWGGFALATVAPRAGMSKRPVVDRFADRQALAVAVWRQRVLPVLMPAIERLLGPGPVQNADDLIESLEPFRMPGTELTAANELLVVRNYEPRIRKAVDSSLQHVLAEATEPVAGALTRADAARQAYILIFGLGLLSLSRGPGVTTPSVKRDTKVIAEALAAETKPLRQPTDSAVYLDEGFVFDTGDPTLERLLQTVLEQVGERGFDGATMVRITKAAKVTEGYIFGRYKTKMDLFIDASDRSMSRTGLLNHEYTKRMDEKGPLGMGEALTIREFMRPGRELLRSIQQEQQRLVRHHHALQRAYEKHLEDMLDSIGGYESSFGVESIHAGEFHTAMAIGLGVTRLAQLRPETWTLPFDVVTVPLAVIQ